jgi:hypothetical protein
MKVKKLLGFCVAFAAASLATVAVQAAQYDVTSELSSDKSTVTMTVTVSPNEGETATTLNGYAVQLDYDSTVLTPQATDSTDETGSKLYAESLINSGITVADLVDNDGDTDTVAIGWADSTAVDVTSDGLAVAKVTFAVKEQEDTSVAVNVLALATDAETLDETNITEKEEATGTVTFTEAFLRGDANGDGKITIDDVTTVVNHVLNVKTIDSDKIDNADATGDGKITIDDITAIVNHVLNVKSIN